jgi:hypothetical protein
VNTHVIVIEQRLRTVWVSTIIAVAAAALVVVGLVAFNTANRSLVRTVIVVADAIVLVALLIELLMALRTVVRVIETTEGRVLEVVYGPNGMVRQVFGPDTLVSARTRSITFRQTWACGYLGSLRLFRWAALATRSGEALELQLVGRRRFIVTVDEPGDFVAALGL